MDFFDPQKQKEHAIRLAVGYALMGVALVLATTILLYQAYGFGFDKHGQVIQNGLVFVSSQPRGSDLYVNGKKYKDKTNTRMNLPAGQYAMELRRDGYHAWKRALSVDGGSVSRFDYPFLFPSVLATTITKQYMATPGLGTQSPDRRWLLVATPDQSAFDLFDLNAQEPTAQPLTVPGEVLAAGSTTKSWELVEWSTDNRHVLLRRMYEKSGQPASEYVLLDREDPALSQNLSIKLGFTPATIELKNGAYDQYYAYDQSSGQLFAASLKQPTPQLHSSGVLAFASQGGTVLYATTQDAPAGKVLVRLRQNNDQPVTVRQMAAGTGYLLDLAMYGGKLYAAAAAQSEGRVYVYQDPLGMLRAEPDIPLAPVQIFKIQQPNYLAFSPNKRFVIAEKNDTFAVYDAETDRAYAYQVPASMDAPQTHATPMDGFRLSYTSSGKLAVFDFDGTNLHTLSAASPAFRPFFDRDYRSVYLINPQNALTNTALLIPKDQ